MTTYLTMCYVPFRSQQGRHRKNPTPLQGSIMVKMTHLTWVFQLYPKTDTVVKTRTPYCSKILNAVSLGGSLHTHNFDGRIGDIEDDQQLHFETFGDGYQNVLLDATCNRKDKNHEISDKSPL